MQVYASNIINIQRFKSEGVEKLEPRGLVSALAIGRINTLPYRQGRTPTLPIVVQQ